MGGQRNGLMRGLVRGLMLAVVILTFGSGLFEAAERNGAFSLAILRRDGILVPFATYDGRWSNPWPAAGKSVDVPIMLGDTPKGWWLDKRPVLDWTLFPLSRGMEGTRSAKVNAINGYRAGCQQGVGLFTDYKPAVLPPPPRVHPYPKDALAYSGDVKIAPIEFASTTDDFAKALLAKLRDEVTGKEDTQVQQYTNFRWTHSYSGQERLNTPIQLEALYRIPKGFTQDLYYYEAVKRYFLPKGKTPEQGAECDLVTFASGYFTATGADGRSIRDLGARVIVTSCDYRNANFLLPLGTVTLDDTTYVIVQWSNATFESYMVMRPHAGRTPTQPIEMMPMVEAPGGACGAESEEERN